MDQFEISEPAAAPAEECRATPRPARRPRRPTAEVRRLILEASRDIFAARGYVGTTTRQVAALAGVSEPLIFSHFGSKEALFAEAVIEPFHSRFADFLEASEDLPPDRELRSGQFVHALYPFLRDNADLLMALVKSRGEMEDPLVHGLDDYFASAVSRMRSQYVAAGLQFDVAPELVVRYSFGMLAGAVLFGDWFFPADRPPDAVAEAALARMIFKASEPAQD